jgi:acyl-CoA reductase-like NAD-dependent aldehyde dehydrogenase
MCVIAADQSFHARTPSICNLHKHIFIQESNTFNIPRDTMPTLTTISPVTNQPIQTRFDTTEAEIPLIAQQAELGFESFRRTSLQDRQDIVLRALELLEQDAATLAQELTSQIGRPASKAEDEIHTAVKRGRYLVKLSDEALKDTPGEPEDGFVRYIKKVPVGPVLIIFAWNVRNPILISST